jgi:hypothetical protein
MMKPMSIWMETHRQLVYFDFTNSEGLQATKGHTWHVATNHLLLAMGLWDGIMKSMAPHLSGITARPSVPSLWMIVF